MVALLFDLNEPDETSNRENQYRNQCSQDCKEESHERSEDSKSCTRTDIGMYRGTEQRNEKNKDDRESSKHLYIIITTERGNWQGKGGNIMGVHKKTY
jgi:hypothetical protein